MADTGTSEFLVAFAKEFVKYKTLWKKTNSKGLRYKCESRMLCDKFGISIKSMHTFRNMFYNHITDICKKAKENNRSPQFYLNSAPYWVRLVESNVNLIEDLSDNTHIHDVDMCSMLGWVEALVCELQRLQSLDAAAFDAAATTLRGSGYVFTASQLHAMWRAWSVLVLQRLRGDEARGPGGGPGLPGGRGPGGGLLAGEGDGRVLRCLLMYSDEPMHNLQSDASGADGDVCERTLEVVSRYGLEQGLSGASCGGPGASCRGLWLRALRDYCGSGPVMPLVLLQRRWHEMKRRARDNFIQYYRNTRATPPSKLHVDIITRYPHVLSQPLPRWKELVSRGLVYDVPMDEARRELKRSLVESPLSNATSEDDVVLIEKNIETIDLVDGTDDNIKLNDLHNNITSKIYISGPNVDSESQKNYISFSNRIEIGGPVNTVELLTAIDPSHVETTVSFDDDDDDDFPIGDDMATFCGDETVSHDKAPSHDINDINMEAGSHDAGVINNEMDCHENISPIGIDESFNVNRSKKLENCIQKLSVDELAAMIEANISNDDVAKIKQGDKMENKNVSKNADGQTDAVVGKVSEDFVYVETVLEDSLMAQSKNDVTKWSCGDGVCDADQRDAKKKHPKLSIPRVNVIDILKHPNEAIHDSVTRYCRKHGVTFDVDMLKRQLSLLCKPLAVSVERLETMERRDRKRKRVELSDIEEVRRINSNILTAQVAPITSHGCHKAPTPSSSPTGTSLSSSAVNTSKTHCDIEKNTLPTDEQTNKYKKKNIDPLQMEDDRNECNRQSNVAANLHGVKPRHKENNSQNTTQLPGNNVTSSNNNEHVQVVTNDNKQTGKGESSNVIVKVKEINSQLKPNEVNVTTGNKILHEDNELINSSYKSITNSVQNQGRNIHVVNFESQDLLALDQVPETLNKCDNVNNATDKKAADAFDDSNDNVNMTVQNDNVPSNKEDVSTNNNTGKECIYFEVPLLNTNTEVPIVAVTVSDVSYRREDDINDSDDTASQDDRRATLVDTHTVTPVITNVTSLANNYIIEIDSDNETTDLDDELGYEDAALFDDSIEQQRLSFTEEISDEIENRCCSVWVKKPRVRMTWSKHVNMFVMRSYYYITKLETDTTRYMRKLHELFTREYPQMYVSRERIADQRRVIVRKNILTEQELNDLKEEVRQKLHNEYNIVDGQQERDVNDINIGQNSDQRLGRSVERAISTGRLQKPMFKVVNNELHNGSDSNKATNIDKTHNTPSDPNPATNVPWTPHLNPTYVFDNTQTRHVRQYLQGKNPTILLLFDEPANARSFPYLVERQSLPLPDRLRLPMRKDVYKLMITAPVVVYAQIFSVLSSLEQCTSVIATGMPVYLYCWRHISNSDGYAGVPVLLDCWRHGGFRTRCRCELTILTSDRTSATRRNHWKLFYIT